MSYTIIKSKSTDFSNNINPGQLRRSIKLDNAITTTLKKININGDVVTIVFVSTPSGSELTALDNLISSYTYVPVLKTITQHNFNAIVDPTTINDVNEGFDIGSRWTNQTSGDSFICVDNTELLAVWKNADTLNGLKDVNISSVTNNDILQYNGTNWINSTITSQFDMPTTHISRSTDFSLTDSYANVTFDNTDIENNTSILEHNNTNTERIDIHDTGLYLIIFGTNMDFENGSSIDAYLEAQIKINDTTVMTNSYSRVGEHYSGSGTFGEDMELSKSIPVTLTTGDYITLQLRRNFSAPSTFDAQQTFLSAIRLTGKTITVSNENQYMESTSVTTTGNSTWTNKMTFTTTSLPLGDYILQYSAEFANEISDQEAHAQLYHTTNTTQLAFQVSCSKRLVSIPYQSFSGTIKLTNISDIHEFKFDILDQVGSSTAIASMKNARINIHRIV